MVMDTAAVDTVNEQTGSDFREVACTCPRECTVWFMATVTVCVPRIMAACTGVLRLS